MGKFNSSKTRVIPVFEALYEHDKSGQKLLRPLLQMANREDGPGPVRIPENLDQLLKKPQFEFPVDPSRAYLKWLITHPERLSSPPREMWEKWSERTQKKRQALLAGHPEAQREAIDKLEKCSELPKWAWWRLEGVTKVDCALLTPSTVVFIEGKRTEIGPSKQVLWYQGRNQVLRNLDCAAAYAEIENLPNYFVMLVVDRDVVGADPLRQKEIDDVTSHETVKISLPHLIDEERIELLSHCLGVTTWQAIIEHFGLQGEVQLD